MRSEKNDLMMTADVARLAEKTPATVRHWERTGQLPAMKTVSGRRVFSRADVERFLAKRREQEAGVAS